MPNPIRYGGSALSSLTPKLHTMSPPAGGSPAQTLRDSPHAVDASPLPFALTSRPSRSLTAPHPLPPLSTVELNVVSSMSSVGSAFARRCCYAWAAEDGDEYEEVWRAMLETAEQWEVPTFPVTGADVLARGIPEGPEVGRSAPRRRRLVAQAQLRAQPGGPTRPARRPRRRTSQEVTARLLASRSRRFYPLVPCSQLVMAGLVPAIHATAHPPTEQSDEMPGTSPGMTVLRAAPYSAASAAPSRP